MVATVVSVQMEMFRGAINKRVAMDSIQKKMCFERSSIVAAGTCVCLYVGCAGDVSIAIRLSLSGEMSLLHGYKHSRAEITHLSL